MHRRAVALLVAAAALPLTPLAAQTEPIPDPPPATDTAPPPADTSPPVITQPVVIAPPPVVTAPPPTVTTRPVVTEPIATEPAPAAAETRRTARSTRTVTRTRTAAAAAAAAPVAAAPAPAAEPAPLAAQAPVETLPAPAAPAETVAPAPEPVRATGVPLWAWLLAGIALLAAVIGLATRRRRVRDEVYYDEPEVVAEPVALRDEPAEYQAPIVSPAFMPAAAEAGEPRLEFDMRPVRAGVGEEDARVEFELGVTNRGNAPARDVRVSAWMLGAGSARSSEMEEALIDRVDIAAGEDANVEASVALPRDGLGEDAIIPVVVAEARYRLPDGSEGRTTHSYEVGVPDDDTGGREMIYFDVENPSGLHDGVVAREIEELETA